MPPINIHQCVCTNQTFAELLKQAMENDWTFEELSKQTGACEGCGLCRPYIRRSLQTGETVFHQILCDETIRKKRIAV